MVFNWKTATETNYLVYEIQWGRWLIPLYTISILGLCYAIQVSMEGERRKMCVDVLGMHGEVEDVFRRAGHAWGGGGGMERGLGVLV